MSKSMLVNVTAEEEHRVAIVDNGVLDVFEIETFSREHLKGDIFKATVEGINTSLEAAFVNYGGDRAGFLPLDEINFKVYPSRNGETGKGRGSRITRHLDKGMEILVQVIRDSFANKPPTMSTYYSLPGRYLVLMPGADAAGISRKIAGEEKRDRLRRILDDLTVPEGFGVIVRTAGMETEPKDLQVDLEALLELWRSIERASKDATPPALIFQDRDLVIRTLRDYYTSDIEEVLIDDEATYKRARTYFDAYMSDSADLVRLYTGDKPIFTKHNIEDQIERIYKRVVQLKSGGTISIDQTEALTAIDVNSARSVRGSSSEDTAVRTNLEAAEEIARQLRLRDIGGLIVIDFIDMESPRRARQVERAFASAMSPDKARYDVTRISKLGLMEISRQRIKASKASSSFKPCPNCSGDGAIRTPEAAARSAFRKIQTRVARGGIAGVHVYLPPDVTQYLLNQKRDDLHRLESRHGIRIEVTPEERLKSHQFEIEEMAHEEEDAIPVVTADTVDEAIASGSIVVESRVETVMESGSAAAAVNPAGKKKRRRRRRRGQGKDREIDAATGDEGIDAAGEQPAPETADEHSVHATSRREDDVIPQPDFSQGPETERKNESAEATGAPGAEADAADKPAEGEGAENSPKRPRRRRRRRGRGRSEGRPGARDANAGRTGDRPGEGAGDRGGGGRQPAEILPAAASHRRRQGPIRHRRYPRPAATRSVNPPESAPEPRAAPPQAAEEKPKRSWWQRAFGKR